LPGALEKKKAPQVRGPEGLVASSSDPVVRCQLRSDAPRALKQSVCGAFAGRVITSIYSLRLKRLEL